jgi:hypothetical protein
MFHFGHIFNFNPFTLRLAAKGAGLQEAPECAAKLADATGTFFVKCTTGISPLEGALENAKRMRSAMNAHNHRVIPKPTNESAVGRFFKMAGLRLSEIFASRKFSDHRSIAEHFGKKIVQSCKSQDRL